MDKITYQVRCSERYLNPVFIRMYELLLSSDVIQQDETPVKVSRDGRPANRNSYITCGCTGQATIIKKSR